MKAITFLLQTQQPLLATSFQGDPNSDVSYSYIPGSMIRGAIIGRYMKLRHLSELDLNNDEVKHLFFDADSTRFLNAYLVSNEGNRTLPTPRSWFRDKDEELSENSPEITVYDFGIERKDKPETPKFVGEGYWTEERRCVRFYKEKRRINIHNQRDRKKGRAVPTKRDRQTGHIREGEGEIYRYEAIDAGQTFQAVILCNHADEKMIKDLKDLLETSDNLWLGGSQSAGYGHTKICSINVLSNWAEINVNPKKRLKPDSFTVTLLSDLILRDEWGQYAVIPPSSLIQDQEDVPQLTPVPLTQRLEEILGMQLNPKASFVSSCIIGGFNRKWGMPLPQVPVLVAGSVFVFEKISITEAQIQSLETQGLGERRNEGFGRVALNWLEKPEFQAKKPDTPRLREKPLLKTEASQALAEQMSERLFQEKLEQKLQKQIGYLTVEGNITNSQLSRLKLVARQALTTADCNLVISLLDNLPSNASGQFERAKLAEGKKQEKLSLKQKLYDWLRNPISCIGNSSNLTVSVAGAERSVTDEIAKTYTLRLIMALAKKAMKERNL